MPKQLREGAGLMNMPAMDVTQIISFFADLLGKSKAAFDSAGIVGKIFYGITTVILKGLNLLGSWISQIADWICGLMGGTVPSSPNWTYGKLLVFAAVAAVILWGVRKIWRRIRGTNGYYESISMDEQKKLLKSIREDSRMFTRMQMLTEAAPQQPAGASTTQQGANQKSAILGKLFDWVLRAKDTSLEILQSLGRDVFRSKNMDPYKQRANSSFDQMISTCSQGVQKFCSSIGANDSKTFIGKACNLAYTNSNITRSLLNCSLFVMFPALTSIWFGGRALSAQALKTPRVQQFIRDRITKPSGDKPPKYSATLEFLARVVYKNPNAYLSKFDVNTKQEAFENLKTEVKNYIKDVGGIRKVFTPQNVGKIISASIRAGVTGAVSGATALYKGGKWGAQQGYGLTTSALGAVGRTALDIAKGMTGDMYTAWGSPVDRDKHTKRSVKQWIGDKMGDLSNKINDLGNSWDVRRAKNKADRAVIDALKPQNYEVEKHRYNDRKEREKAARAARAAHLQDVQKTTTTAANTEIGNINEKTKQDLENIRKVNRR